MNRRQFIHQTAALAAAGGVSGSGPSAKASNAQGKIMTVLGPLDPQRVGLMLPHEHVMSTFGSDAAITPNYDREKLFAAVVPYFCSLKETGCGALADCTTLYFGRDVTVLKAVSEKTGIHILTNTGYYGAANDRYVPAHAYEETAEQLAARWASEWQNGIDGTGIRPGFIKTGVDAEPLSDIDAKLVRAAAKTHRKTGLLIAVHTGNNPASAQQQLGILREEGVHPSAWVWVHANSVQDFEALRRAAEAGAWIEFDGLGSDNVERHLDCVKRMKKIGLLNRVMLSHDGNMFRPDGRAPRTCDALFNLLIPAMEKAGISRREIRRMTVENPAKAFTVKVRTQS